VSDNPLHSVQHGGEPGKPVPLRVVLAGLQEQIDVLADWCEALSDTSGYTAHRRRDDFRMAVQCARVPVHAAISKTAEQGGLS